MVSRTERSRLGAKKGRVLTAMLVDRCLDGFPLRARATGAPECTSKCDEAIGECNVIQLAFVFIGCGLR
jgi:hypothetical protein